MLEFQLVDGKILDKAPDNFKMEKADLNDNDIMHIKAFAIEEGLNANSALFEKDDLNKSVNTFIGKPLKIRFVNNDPTGHGYNPQTGEFDELVDHIGYIYDAWGGYFDDDGKYLGEDEGGTYKIIVYIAMWQLYFPQIALRLRQLHSNGDLKFSIEATRDYEITEEGYRRCFNIVFNGLAVVKTPAFEKAKSLMVAEILNNKEGNSMDFEKMYNELKPKYDNVVGKLAIAEDKLEKAETDIETLKGEKADLDTEIAEVTGDLKTVKAERDTLVAEKEQQAKAELAEARYEKLSKYGEVSKTKEELAEMTKEEFADILVEMVDNYEPTNMENSEKEDNLIGVNYETKGKEKIDRKGTLLEMIEGFSK